MGILLQPVQARRQGLAIPLTSIGQEEQLEVMWSAWPHDCAFLAPTWPDVDGKIVHAAREAGQQDEQLAGLKDDAVEFYIRGTYSFSPLLRKSPIWQWKGT